MREALTAAEEKINFSERSINNTIVMIGILGACVLKCH